MRPNREDFFVGFPVSVSFSCFTPVPLTRRQPASCPNEFERLLLLLLLLLLSGQQRCIRQTYWSAFLPRRAQRPIKQNGNFAGESLFRELGEWMVRGSGLSYVDGDVLRRYLIDSSLYTFQLLTVPAFSPPLPPKKPCLLVDAFSRAGKK